MAATLIGYYPAVDTHYSNIQGSFYEISEDPIYQQSYDRAFLPADSKPDSKNKEYVPNPDFFGGDLVEFYGKGAELNMAGYGLSIAGGNYMGQGLRMAGGKFGRYKIEDIPTMPIPSQPMHGTGPLQDIAKYTKKVGTVAVNMSPADYLRTYKKIGERVLNRSPADYYRTTKKLGELGVNAISKATKSHKKRSGKGMKGKSQMNNTMTSYRKNRPGSGLKKRLAQQYNKLDSELDINKKRRYLHNLFMKLH